jgi:hypothetical protein
MRCCHGMLVLIIPCGYAFSESSIGVTPESGWDMASLTKIMVTTPCVMVLYDRGLIGKTFISLFLFGSVYQWRLGQVHYCSLSQATCHVSLLVLWLLF